MEIVAAQHLQFPPKPHCLMTTPLSSKLSPSLLRLTPAACRRFATTTSAATTTAGEPEVVTVSERVTPKPRPNGSTRGTSRVKKVSLDARQLKLNWLGSLSCPFPANSGNRVSVDSECGNVESGWVIGVDPDISGALAVLKPDNSVEVWEVTKKSVSSLPTIRVPDQIYEAGVLGKKHKEPFHTRQAWRAKILLELVHSDLCYVEVFDSPHLKVLVGKRVRKRLDVKSIIQLLQNVDAPIGSTVYIEQSIPYPQDGKQGWWSGGFGYGLWIGILVALGYSVIPVPSSLWKNEFKLTGYHSSKDDSRELASTLFPSMSSLLKRKKDHGRAEALLIAAYGKGLKVNFDATRILEDLMP